MPNTGLNNTEIYVVQCRSGIVFNVTTDYESAKETKKGLDSINGGKGKILVWVNGKKVRREL